MAEEKHRPAFNAAKQTGKYQQLVIPEASCFSAADSTVTRCMWNDSENTEDFQSHGSELCKTSKEEWRRKDNEKSAFKSVPVWHKLTHFLCLDQMEAIYSQYKDVDKIRCIKNTDGC